MKNPNLSVGILAQNGVYAFFSAAFVPVLFGIFVKTAKKQAVIIASVTAILVHFSVYYLNLSYYTSSVVKNPAVAATYAILSSVAIAIILQIFLNHRYLKFIINDNIFIIICICWFNGIIHNLHQI